MPKKEFKFKPFGPLVMVPPEERRAELNRRIKANGCRPQTCPVCKEKTLYPKKHEVVNALSKKEDIYICSVCGMDETAQGLVRKYY